MGVKTAIGGRTVRSVTLTTRWLRSSTSSVGGSMIKTKWSSGLVLVTSIRMGNLIVNFMNTLSSGRLVLAPIA